MCVSLKKHLATENRSYEWCVKNTSEFDLRAKNLIAKLLPKIELSPSSKILEIGSAQGMLLNAIEKKGYKSIYGVEPSTNALKISDKIKKINKANFRTFKASAERLPFKENFFDLVIAESVMEHVTDPDKVFSEISRVLKPGGAFYVMTSSILCPAQSEIRFFPFFSWYPDRLKKKIMRWSQSNAPHLIGYTSAPAMHWFSYSKLAKLAKRYDFKTAYCRWDLVSHSSVIGRILSHNIITRSIGNLVIPGTACLFIK